ncbi:ParB/RepB/Spo0J family plasmid partition protein [Xenorhabdus bovienii]|uniref:ParB/RepB/Spo0J family plasmid partition protein n=1 Tax=Xenorhabdus bovienii TaxID=40576 RepID=UPI00237C800D|nr:ParB/RepB/Spo0J family plasmid partition protein [Xenorhabdus bovienii]
MKRAKMKNAPNIDWSNTPSSNIGTSGQSSAPSVNTLRARVNSMTGNQITLPVAGRDVVFTLKTIPATMVEKSTMVWLGNERDQEFLTENALSDIIPTFKTTGQQTPAFGRNVSGIIEIADGSRRRKAAIFTEREYRVLDGDLDDEQMQWLSTIGNDYRPTSAFERGQRYSRLLSTKFNENISQLAISENISRKVITRCVSTAKLPREIIALFSHPGELSARSGESLYKSYLIDADAMFSFASHLSNRQKNQEKFSTDEIIRLLTDVVIPPKKQNVLEKKFTPGARATYRGNKFTLTLDTSKIPESIIHQIESLLEIHSKNDIKSDE